MRRATTRRTVAIQSPSSTLTQEYACTSAESVGDCVSLYGAAPDSGLQVVRRTNISNAPFRRSIGVIISKSSSTRCLVAEAGPIDGVYSGLEVGRDYGVGLDSRLTANLPVYPTSGQQLLMLMGTASSPTVIIISPQAVGIRNPS